MLTTRTFNDSFTPVTSPAGSFDTPVRGAVPESSPTIEKDSYTPHPRRGHRPRSEAFTPPETRSASSKMAELEQKLLAKLIAWLEKESPEPAAPAQPLKATMTVTPCEAPAPAPTPASPQEDEPVLLPEKAEQAPPENPVWNFVRTGLNLGLNAGAAIGLGMIGASLFGPVGLALGAIALFGLVHSGNEWIK